MFPPIILLSSSEKNSPQLWLTWSWQRFTRGWNVSRNFSPCISLQSACPIPLPIAGLAAPGIASPQWPSYTCPISYFSAWVSLWSSHPYCWLEWSCTSSGPSQHPGSNLLPTFPGVLWIHISMSHELAHMCPQCTGTARLVARWDGP